MTTGHNDICSKLVSSLVRPSSILDFDGRPKYELPRFCVSSPCIALVARIELGIEATYLRNNCVVGNHK